MNNVRRLVKQIEWKKVALGAIVAIPLAIIVVQFIYPFDRTMLNARVDSVDVGNISRDEAVARIGEVYKKAKLNVYFGDASEPYRSPSLSELGVAVDSAQAVDAIMYPWWLRLVPTSLWWGQTLAKSVASNVSLSDQSIHEYAEKEFGESCNITPKDASIVIKDSELSLSPAVDGGTCKLDDVTKLMAAATVSAVDTNKVKVSLNSVAPKVSDTVAQDLIDRIESQLKDGITVMVEKEAIRLDVKAVRSWLIFEEKDKKLAAKIDPVKAKDALNEKLQSKVAKVAGSVTVKVVDGKEVSRTGNDTKGRALDVNTTADNITKYLLGELKTINVAVTTLNPQIKYEKSYSSTAAGLSAVIRSFAESNPGVYGVSLVELSGQRRTASYNDTRNFFPASTYKLFIAFSTLKRVDKGEYKWTDKKVGGYTLPNGNTLSSCFDTMIVNSDNACAETLRDVITYAKLNQDLRSIGIYNTTFIAPGQHKSTAKDITAFLVKLESGSLPVSSANRSKLLGAMKRNVYRSGIPSGASGTVADKVGFIDNLLHDAAIVYSPKGTYVLTIMTDGSSWANIAKLTREIEKFRAQ